MPTRLFEFLNASGHRLSPPDVFSRSLSIDGTITQAQRAQLLDMAQRCPIHRTLEEGARFEPVEGGPPA